MAPYTLPFIKTPFFMSNSRASVARGKGLRLLLNVQATQRAGCVSRALLTHSRIPAALCLPAAVGVAVADAWQASNIMGLNCNPAQAGSCNASQIAYLQNFRDVMIQALQPIVGTKNGGYLLSCFIHVIVGEFCLAGPSVVPASSNAAAAAHPGCCALVRRGACRRRPQLEPHARRGPDADRHLPRVVHGRRLQATPRHRWSLGLQRLVLRSCACGVSRKERLCAGRDCQWPHW